MRSLTQHPVLPVCPAPTSVRRAVPLAALLAVLFVAPGCASIRKGKKEGDLVKRNEPESGTAAADQEWYRKSMASKQSPELTTAYAQFLETQDQSDAARAQYERALKMNSKYAPAELGLARVEFALGNYAAAEPHLARALQLGPNDVEVLTTAGAYRSSRGEHVAAERLLRKAVSVAPGDKTATQQLGVALARSGRFEEARRLLSSDAATACFYLGAIHEEQNRPAAARAEFSRALAINPRHVEARQRLAALSTQAGQGPGQVRTVGHRRAVPVVRPGR